MQVNCYKVIDSNLRVKIQNIKNNQLNLIKINLMFILCSMKTYNRTKQQNYNQTKNISNRQFNISLLCNLNAVKKLCLPRFVKGLQTICSFVIKHITLLDYFISRIPTVFSVVYSFGVFFFFYHVCWFPNTLKTTTYPKSVVK